MAVFGSFLAALDVPSVLLVGSFLRYVGEHSQFRVICIRKRCLVIQKIYLVNGEKYFVICVEHVIGEEKYECVTLNIFVMESKRFCERVCCNVFSGFFCWYVRIISLI